MESSSIFDREVKHLFTQLNAVFEERDKRTLNLEVKPDTMRSALTKYINIYEKTKPEEHHDYFRNLFVKNKVAALAVIKTDDWLKQEGVTVVFGDGTPHAQKGISVRISYIYRLALENKDKAEIRLKGLPDQASAECYELIRNEIILLHLYRIFREIVIDADDKAAISSIVSHYERILNMKEGDSKATTPSPNDPLSALGPNPIQGLSSIFSSMMGSMQNINTNMANGGTGPLPALNGDAMKDMSTMLNGVLNNPSTQSIVSQIFGGLQGAKDPMSALSGLGQTLNDPKFLEAVRSTIPSSANSALEGKSEIVPIVEALPAVTLSTPAPPVVPVVTLPSPVVIAPPILPTPVRLPPPMPLPERK